jgi:hypothetical protein
MTFILAKTSFELPPEHTAILRIRFLARGEKKVFIVFSTSSPTGYNRTQSQRAFSLTNEWTSFLIEYVLSLNYEPGTCSVDVSGYVEDDGDFELHPDVRQEDVLGVEIVACNRIKQVEEATPPGELKEWLLAAIEET